jgi:lipoyl(octanoyl) transferase
MSTGDLAALGVAVHTVDRGGAATYHGPGQIVCYPIIHLGQARLRVKEYVAKLEEAALRTIRSFGAKADTQEGRIGVWTGSHDKIASIGIRVTHRVTCHGLSLNVRLDRDPSRFVVTCDIADARQVSLTDIAVAPCTPAEVRAALTRSLADVLDVDIRVTRGEDW